MKKSRSAEEIRQYLSDMLAGLNEEIEATDARLEQMHKHIERVEATLEAVEFLIKVCDGEEVRCET